MQHLNAHSVSMAQQARRYPTMSGLSTSQNMVRRDCFH